MLWGRESIVPLLLPYPGMRMLQTRLSRYRLLEFIAMDCKSLFTYVVTCVALLGLKTGMPFRLAYQLGSVLYSENTTSPLPAPALPERRMLRISSYIHYPKCPGKTQKSLSVRDQGAESCMRPKSNFVSLQYR